MISKVPVRHFWGKSLGQILGDYCWELSSLVNLVILSGSKGVTSLSGILPWVPDHQELFPHPQPGVTQHFYCWPPVLVQWFRAPLDFRPHHDLQGAWPLFSVDRKTKKTTNGSFQCPQFHFAYPKKLQWLPKDFNTSTCHRKCGWLVNRRPQDLGSAHHPPTETAIKRPAPCPAARRIAR